MIKRLFKSFVILVVTLLVVFSSFYGLWILWNFNEATFIGFIGGNALVYALVTIYNVLKIWEEKDD